jgi:hypothetical protein
VNNRNISMGYKKGNILPAVLTFLLEKRKVRQKKTGERFQRSELLGHSASRAQLPHAIKVFERGLGGELFSKSSPPITTLGSRFRGAVGCAMPKRLCSTPTCYKSFLEGFKGNLFFKKGFPFEGRTFFKKSLPNKELGNLLLKKDCSGRIYPAHSRLNSFLSG